MLFRWHYFLKCTGAAVNFPFFFRTTHMSSAATIVRIRAAQFETLSYCKLNSVFFSFVALYCLVVA